MTNMIPPVGDQDLEQVLSPNDMIGHEVMVMHGAVGAIGGTKGELRSVSDHDFPWDKVLSIQGPSMVPKPATLIS